MATNHTLEGTSESLVSGLTASQEDIPWAADTAQIFGGIKNVYLMFADAGEVPPQVREVHEKVRELERYLIIDLHRHIALRNGRSPYYLSRFHELLHKTQAIIGRVIPKVKGKSQYDGSRHDLKDLDHIAAEFQTAFVEYGFCQCFEVLYNIEEANRRLDAIDVKLTSVERSLKAGDNIAAIVDLHDAIAQQHGVQQVLTEGNMLKIKRRYDDMTNRIARLENSLCKERLQNDSSILDNYTKMLTNMQREFVGLLFKSDPIDVINGNMIHPGTRAWLLERIHRFVYGSKKKIFYLGGKTGTGKTAMAATLCKLYGGDVIAEHFFNAHEGDSLVNHIDGLIQSIAADLCRSCPEYLEYLTEKYGDIGYGFRPKLAGGWESLYNLLLKEPLTAIYGGGKSPPAGRRKIIVIDGLDECSQSEWADVKAFLTSYMKDMSPTVCIFATVRMEVFSNLMPLSEDFVEGIRLEDRAWMNRHIKDIEVYLAGSLGAILSGEDEVDTPGRARADEMTLQDTVDELLKNSAGRFDYAIELMEAFAQEMNASGQFLTSVKKAMMPIRRTHAKEFEDRTSDFASPFRAYRDKEGRSVSVRVMRQSQYPMDKSRVALIRGRHKIKQ